MAVTAPRAAKKNSLRNQQPEFLPFRRSLWLWKGLARQKPERCGDLFTFYLQSAWGISPYCFLTLRKWRRESSKRERKKKKPSFLEFCSWDAVHSQLPANTATSHPGQRVWCLCWPTCRRWLGCFCSHHLRDQMHHSSCCSRLLKPHCKSSVFSFDSLW